MSGIPRKRCREQQRYRQKGWLAIDEISHFSDSYD
jgi:hypothetical protein